MAFKGDDQKFNSSNGLSLEGFKHCSGRKTPSMSQIALKLQLNSNLKAFCLLILFPGGRFNPIANCPAVLAGPGIEPDSFAVQDRLYTDSTFMECNSWYSNLSKYRVVSSLGDLSFEHHFILTARLSNDCVVYNGELANGDFLWFLLRGLCCSNF